MSYFNANTIRKFALAGSAGAMLIAVPFVGGWEGLRNIAYLDPVGVPTICYGHTAGVKPGQRMSDDECKELLAGELGEYMAVVDREVHVSLPDTRRAALTSFVYNVGETNFRGSTLLRKLNAGQTEAACNELLRWVYAKGRKLKGLVRRREAERELCLIGVSEGI